ncbi:MAG: phage portal protein [Chloroflexota bacterium]
MFDNARRKVARWIAPSESKIKSTRAHPIQRRDRVDWMYAPNPPQLMHSIQYAINHYVYTAINRLAREAASAEFMITSRPDGMERSHTHGLLDLVGKFGKPNSGESSLEFWERHFQFLGISGNSYWLWESDIFGSPTRIHLLEPEYMRIIPGADRTVGEYLYTHRGVERRYHEREVTHFLRGNPFSRYYGLSPLQVLYWLAVSDNFMLRWNRDFFDDELGLPSGIVIVPADTSEAEMKRIQAEFIAEHGGRRRVAFVKSDLGKAVWQEAGLKHKDYDFMNGRELGRKGIYEALELPLGLMSESSTEAHAIVSERDLMRAVHFRHMRTAYKLNVDGLDFWPEQKLWQAEFEDVRRRAVDWRRERDRLETDAMALSLDELRAREHGLPALASNVQTVAQLLKPGGSNGSKIGNEEIVGQIPGGQSS